MGQECRIGISLRDRSHYGEALQHPCRLHLTGSPPPGQPPARAFRPWPAGQRTGKITSWAARREECRSPYASAPPENGVYERDDRPEARMPVSRATRLAVADVFLTRKGGAEAIARRRKRRLPAMVQWARTRSPFYR